MANRIYHILNWNEHFENAKSRAYKNCSFVCIPNKHDGEGFNRIMAEPDGMAIFGVWTAIVQICSRQIAPRDGWLTSNGKRKGVPFDAEYLAFRFRRTDRNEIQRCLDFVSSQVIGWVEVIQSDPVVSDSDTGQIPRSLEGRKEGKEEGTPDGNPPPPSIHEGGSEKTKDWLSTLRVILAGFDLSNNSTDCEEWRGALKSAGIRHEESIKDFLEWAVPYMKRSYPDTVLHKRHVGTLMTEWNARRKKVSA